MSHEEFEPIPGLPERLPPGEQILWQGAPGWRQFALRTFHIPAVGGYFLLLLVWSLIANRSAGFDDDLRLTGLGCGALSVLAGLAWLSARATLYTITNHRIVIRSGIALPLVLNIPFKAIEKADLKTYGDSSGDIVLQVVPAQRLPYVVLWPNVRPWRFAHTQPMLRGVAGVLTAAQILGRALAARAETAAPILSAPQRPRAADTALPAGTAAA